MLMSEGLPTALIRAFDPGGVLEVCAGLGEKFFAHTLVPVEIELPHALVGATGVFAVVKERDRSVPGIPSDNV
jgi:hypothetical protein